MAAALLVIAAASPAPADLYQPTPEPTPEQRGAFQTQFNQRAPEHVFKSTVKYDIAQETFEMYVPRDYQEGAPYGVLVFIDAVDAGVAFPALRPVLDRRHLIWVGAKASGNEHPVARRMSLAMDAVYNIARRYSLDQDRVYVSGFSGGGRVASLLAPNHPGVFRGAIYMSGCNHPEQIEKLAKARSRFVFLTGDKDFNREGTQKVYEDYLNRGFVYATYLQVPDLPHDLPDAEWFDRAVATLDQPLATTAGDLLRSAAAIREKGTKLGEAWVLYRKAQFRAEDPGLLEKARSQAEAIEQLCRQRIDQTRQTAGQGQNAKAVGVLLQLKKQFAPLAQAEIDQLLVEFRGTPRGKRSEGRETPSGQPAE